jgi:hypothetical protein
MKWREGNRRLYHGVMLLFSPHSFSSLAVLERRYRVDAQAMTATDWITAISTAISAISSVVLFAVAFVQLRGLKDQLKQSADQERRKSTLDVVERVEHDEALREAYKVIWENTSGGTDYSKTATPELKYHVLTILNYFEGIAIGIAQKVYVDSMARDYLNDIVKKAVEIWLIGESADNTKLPSKMFDKGEFTELRKLYDRWFAPPRPVYDADSL